MSWKVSRKQQCESVSEQIKYRRRNKLGQSLDFQYYQLYDDDDIKKVCCIENFPMHIVILLSAVIVAIKGQFCFLQFRFHSRSFVLHFYEL